MTEQAAAVIADTTDFLREQLNKDKSESKKWQVAKIGLYGIAGFFVISVAVFVFQPIAAASVVVLCQTCIGAWTAVVGVYLGAQGSVDYKTTQALANSVVTPAATANPRAVD